MIKIRWMTLLTIAQLWSTAAFSADADSVPTSAVPSVTLSVATTLIALRYPSRWQPFQSGAAPTAGLDNWLQPIAGSDVLNSAALTRQSKVKSLSLLTLAEAGQARLFLGVNRKGLLGLHFVAFSDHGGGRLLEMVRMPYLAKSAGE